MNLMHANLCRWPHYCGEMDCLIKHIIRHICRLADQIEAVFFEQIPFVKFVSVHAAVSDLGHREEEAGSLVYQVKVSIFPQDLFHMLSVCLLHVFYTILRWHTVQPWVCNIVQQWWTIVEFSALLLLLLLFIEFPT